MVVYLAILGGIGTAGVPSGSIPFIIAVLATVGVNPALIAIILGVDRILDMCRTTLNVVGDLTAATYVARSEGFPLLGRPAGQGLGLLHGAGRDVLEGVAHLAPRSGARAAGPPPRPS